MQFLWRSQLKKERGKFMPLSAPVRKQNRRERLGEFKKSTSSYLGAVFLWLLFFGTLIYLVFFSSYLALHEPTVSGLEHIDQRVFLERVHQELDKKYFGQIARQRYFLLQPKQLEVTLQSAFPLIQSIRVTRIFPNAFEIHVIERDTLLLWCALETCTHILEDGSTVPVTSEYDDEENRSRTLVLRDLSGQALPVGSNIFESDSVAFPLGVRQVLREQFSLDTESEMSVSSRFANELRVKTTQGFEIFFSTRIALETSLSALRLLFEKEISEGRRRDLQYIDLRTENRVFYRYQEGKNDPGMSAEEHVVEKTKNAKSEEESTKKK